MNLLTHLLLAERTRTSAAGQILGDLVKGRLDTRYSAAIRRGIRLHRAIDRFSDAHENHRAMRDRFAPPLRRYAGILVDIGFDHSLARAWPEYSAHGLVTFAELIERRVRREWPPAAPVDARRVYGLGRILAGYAEPAGVQRALDSVARRLSRRNPMAQALPRLLAHRKAFDARLAALITDLDAHVRTLAPCPCRPVA